LVEASSREANCGNGGEYNSKSSQEGGMGAEGEISREQEEEKYKTLGRSMVFGADTSPMN